MSSDSYIHEQNIMVAMRDGVRLATDVFRPRGEGRWPVLLTRVPYNKDVRVPEDKERYVFLELDFDVARAIEAGYVVVAQDTRGRFGSEGEFRPFLDEARDGADTVAWAASQPWSTGQIGMFGVSYQGQTQWQAASEQPAALKAIAPCQAPEWMVPLYQGGAFLLSVVLGWAVSSDQVGELQRRLSAGTLTQEYVQQFWHTMHNLQQWYDHVPLDAVPLPAEKAAYYLDWLHHPPHDDYWQRFTPEVLYPQITVPALIIAGWHDLFLNRNLAHFRGMRQLAGSAQAREETRLVVGPWSHGEFTGVYAERDQGSHASAEAIDLGGMQLRWFDLWLKGQQNAIAQQKPVLMFVMGLNEWREEEDWPPPGTQYLPFYLHSAGKANTAAGDGILSNELPGDETADSYVYDPRQPVPSVGGLVHLIRDELPFEQSKVEEREDVLCYTSAPLEQAIEVIGPVTLVLSISSSAPDTDFTGKLVDVYPDGRALRLTDGILRARYREALSTPSLLEPEHIYELRIELGATANLFQAGHRIRLEVSSSNFPCFDRNTNTGGNIVSEHIEDFQVARNRVYHDVDHPSYLLLPCRNVR